MFNCELKIIFISCIMASFYLKYCNGERGRFGSAAAKSGRQDIMDSVNYVNPWTRIIPGYTFRYNYSTGGWDRYAIQSRMEVEIETSTIHTENLKIQTTTTTTTTVLPEPITDNSAVLIAKIFAGVSVLAFCVVLIVVIVKVRKSLKRTFMSMSIVRDLRDISEYERERERERRAAALLRDVTQLRQLRAAAAEYSGNGTVYLDQLENLFPFEVVLREDLDIPSPLALQRPPSYETLFQNQNTMIIKDSDVNEDEEEPPPPRYSAIYRLPDEPE